MKGVYYLETYITRKKKNKDFGLRRKNLMVKDVLFQN